LLLSPKKPAAGESGDCQKNEGESGLCVRLHVPILPFLEIKSIYMLDNKKGLVGAFLFC
jgi:hypothetical protein